MTEKITMVLLLAWMSLITCMSAWAWLHAVREDENNRGE